MRVVSVAEALLRCREAAVGHALDGHELKGHVRMQGRSRGKVSAVKSQKPSCVAGGPQLAMPLMGMS